MGQFEISMSATNLTAAFVLAHIMPCAHHSSVVHVELRQDEVEQLSFVVLAVTSQRIGTEVSDLHQAGQMTIDEQGCFDDQGQGRPARALTMKTTHQVR